MKPKVFEHEGKKYVEMNDDDKPIYVDDAGEETAYDPPVMATRLNEVNGESAARRRELKELNDKMKQFEGIDDPTDALKALETVRNLDQKQLVDAGEVEKVKTEAIKATKEQYESLIEQTYKPLETETVKLKGQLQKEMIGGRFARSKFVNEKMLLEAPHVQRLFEHHFQIEDEKVVPKYTNGDPVYSKDNPGSIADFDEALSIIVTNDPHAESLLKADNKRGSNAPGSGNRGGDDKTMSVAEFEKMPFTDRNKFMTEGGKLINDAA